ncbi:hypothetical protein D9M68_912530 [compost metagenome]
MPTYTFERDLKAVGTGGNWTGTKADLTGRRTRHVQSKSEVRARKALQQPIVNHCFGASPEFLGWLRDEQQCAFPSIL